MRAPIKNRCNLFPQTKFFNKQMQLKTPLKKLFALPILLILLLANNALAASSDWSDAAQGSGKVRLVASFYEKDGQKKLIGGAHFKINKGWKIYGNDDSGFGLPPQFNFEKSENYLAPTYQAEAVVPQQLNYAAAFHQP